VQAVNNHVPAAVVRLSLLENTTGESYCNVSLKSVTPPLVPVGPTRPVLQTKFLIMYTRLLYSIDASCLMRYFSLRTSLQRRMSRISDQRCADLIISPTSEWVSDRLPEMFIGRACRQSITVSGAHRRVVSCFEYRSLCKSLTWPGMPRFHEPVGVIVTTATLVYRWSRRRKIYIYQSISAFFTDSWNRLYAFVT